MVFSAALFVAVRGIHPGLLIVLIVSKVMSTRDISHLMLKKMWNNMFIHVPIE